MNDRDERRRKDSGTWSALLMLCVISLLFLALMSVVLPDAFLILLVIFGLVIFCYLHYLLWGRWLSKRLKETMPDDSHEDDEFLKKYGPLK